MKSVTVHIGECMRRAQCCDLWCATSHWVFTETYLPIPTAGLRTDSLLELFIQKEAGVGFEPLFTCYWVCSVNHCTLVCPQESTGVLTWVLRCMSDRTQSPDAVAICGHACTLGRGSVASCLVEAPSHRVGLCLQSNDSSVELSWLSGGC